MKKRTAFCRRIGFLFLVITVSCAVFPGSGETEEPSDPPPVSLAPTGTLDVPPTNTPRPEPTEKPPAVIQVDDFGANPFDQEPDSESIQEALRSMRSGDTLLFTSPNGIEGYNGYLVDRTLFLMIDFPKDNLTFGSTHPESPALLIASEELKGFVIHLYSRAAVDQPGLIDNITLRDLSIDAGREGRVCAGPDGILNGKDDNWGSWIPNECLYPDDPWCNAGGISLPGLVNFGDYSQNYKVNPDQWTTGLVVDHLTIANVECGTALGLSGAASSITNTVIDTAGEHTHAGGCKATDPDGELMFWSDGITFDGTDITVENNTIINPSDVGIVNFGGKGIRIAHNTVVSEAGNYGAFAGIAVHPWGFGNISGLEVIGNQVSSTSDSFCGGLHVGINIGAFMWGRGCVGEAGSGTIGVPGECSNNPAPPQGIRCVVGQPCQVWAAVPAGEMIILRDNEVSGAHINYLVGGVDNQGEMVIENNTSLNPRYSCWEAARYGCFGKTWGPQDFVALFPSLPGWTAMEIFCER